MHKPARALHVKSLLQLVGPSFWSGLITAGKALSQLLLLKVVATVLGASALGMVGQALGLVTILQNFAGGGIINGVIRGFNSFSDNKARQRDFISASFTLGLAATALILSVCVLFSGPLTERFFGDRNFTWLLWLTGLASLPIFLGAFVQSLLTAQTLVQPIFWVQLSATLVGLPLALYLTYAHQVEGALLGVFLLGMLQSAFMVIYAFKQNWFRSLRLKLTLDWQSKKTLLPFATLTLVNGFLVPMVLVLLRAQVESHLGWESVGHWQAVLKMSEVNFSFIGLVLLATYFPKVSQSKSGDEAFALTKQFLLSFVPMVCALLVLLGLAAPMVLHLAYSAAFSEQAGNLRVLLAGDAFRSVGGVFSYLLLARGKFRIIFVAELLAVIALYAMCEWGLEHGLSGLLTMQALHSVLYCGAMGALIQILTKKRAL